MSKVAASYCEAIEAEFVWGVQLCMQPAVTSAPGYVGDEFGVCHEHSLSLRADA
jgi:hypothetical protein